MGKIFNHTLWKISRIEIRNMNRKNQETPVQRKRSDECYFTSNLANIQNFLATIILTRYYLWIAVRLALAVSSVRDADIKPLCNRPSNRDTPRVSHSLPSLTGEMSCEMGRREHGERELLERIAQRYSVVRGPLSSHSANLLCLLKAYFYHIIGDSSSRSSEIAVFNRSENIGRGVLDFLPKYLPIRSSSR